MWLLLDQLFAFALLVGTFIYIRSVGAVLRSLMPKALAHEQGLPLTTALYVGPTAAVGLALYFAQVRGGVVWISLVGVYLSWVQDLVYIVGMTYYYFILRRIRHRPASFESLIQLRAYAAWPSSDVVRRPLDYLLPRLPFIKSWKKPSVMIKPADFQRFLKGNTRLIDYAELNLLPLSYLDFCAVPHFPLPVNYPGNFTGNEPDEESAPRARRYGAKGGPVEHLENQMRDSFRRYFGEPPKKVRPEPEGEELQSAAVRFYLMNRALNFELTEELWQTSQRICRTMPGSIARTWKGFHFQQSVRLRYLSLFNTADQLQRLLGSIVLSRVRDAGHLREGMLGNQKFRVPASPVQWAQTIEQALLTEDTGLDAFRSLLLASSDNYMQWQDRLRPFAEVIGGPIVFPEGQRHLLAGLSLLSVLRNKIIGHGGVGSQLRMQPLVYLSALHYFFLELAKEILKLDIQVFAVMTERRQALRDQAVALPLQLAGEHVAVAKAQGLGPIRMHPYLRYRDGRLLIIDRATKEGVTFVDYEAHSVEPTYLMFEIDPDDFLMPAPAWNSA
jgi:hypothetical protein